MSERKFQAGDFVVCVLPNGGDEVCEDGPQVGMVGIVRTIGTVSGRYGVEFWQHTSAMHTLLHRLGTRNGWWCSEESLEFAEPEGEEDLCVPNLDLVL